MSRLPTPAQYVLAFLGLFAVIQPLPVLFTPPDPSSQLIASGVALVIAAATTVAFVRRSLSVQRLFLFILCMFLAAFVVLAAVSLVLESLGISYASLADYGIQGIAFQLFLLLASYAIAFWLVYRGGYARLTGRIS